jgi:hypothetical protein
MFKKLFIGLAPLLVIAALAVMPVAAQAVTQHWYKSGVVIPENEAVPVVWFGGETNLNQTSPGFGEVNCKTVGGGMIENGRVGQAGVGGMNAVAFYECKGPQCEAEILAKTGLAGRETVEAKNMPASINGHPERRFVPWLMELEESIVAGVNSIRLKIGVPWPGVFNTPSPPGMIRLSDSCEIASTEVVVSEAIFEGELKPEIGAAKKGNLNGTSAAKPSAVRFEGASTGALHSAAAGEGIYFNTLKYLGYNEQELITVKP